MSRDGRAPQRFMMAATLLIGGTLLLGCEEAGTDSTPSPSVTQAPPPPASTTQTQGGSTRSGSALGQAKRQAESTVDKLEKRQQELIKQMDGQSD